MIMNFFYYTPGKNDDEVFITGEEKNEFFISGEEKRRGVAEQYYKREADWKEAGEERSDERAWISSDNISGTSELS